MDFTLTPEQDLLRSTARTLLAHECPTSLVRAHIDDRAAQAPLWQHLRDFAALGTGECSDLCLFLDETGYVAAPGPFFASAAMAAPLLAAVGSAHLDGVLDGSVVATVALAGADGGWMPNADPVKTFVLDADLADVIVVVHPGHVVIADSGAREGMTALETVDFSRRTFRVDSGTLPGDTVAIDAGALADWQVRVTTAYAAETVGVARRCFDMALAYAKERVQFDRPIGSFQAIQHKLAEMSLLVERATASVHYAAMAVDADDADRTRAAHVARAAAGDAARRCLKDSMQIHGGIGYTWEHDLQMFLRRATASEYLLGSTGWHHDRIADLLFG